ncbi:uncharacterized protein RCC_08376 [Ramularia collo-cygni]|uniref:Uncharacterized protein n=1 Tax=Ramularia collo-cygni TaxID=112498 RepID=A0A2D3VF28_9PEZI|nr:uncharacterized protein RCC_08376 [Ramularia collo-cygni]CZT22671.1 uncharacterized protein RCC_08376 [Ramularia collo-cygni]
MSAMHGAASADAVSSYDNDTVMEDDDVGPGNKSPATPSADSQIDAQDNAYSASELGSNIDYEAVLEGELSKAEMAALVVQHEEALDDSITTRTSFIGHSLDKLDRILSQATGTIKASQNPARRMCDIRDHPAAQDPNRSWRSLPLRRVREDMTQDDWARFTEDFSNAAVVDVGMMTCTVRGPLELIVDDIKRRNLPPDPFAHDEQDIREALSGLSEEELFDEDAKISNLLCRSINGLKILVDALNDLHQRVARTRCEVHVALDVCRRTDPLYNQRPLNEQLGISKSLLMRAVSDTEPIQTNKRQNEALWSQCAFVPQSTRLTLLAQSLDSITLVRNSAFALSSHARGYVEKDQRDFRRREDEALDRARQQHPRYEFLERRVSLPVDDEDW